MRGYSVVIYHDSKYTIINYNGGKYLHVLQKKRVMKSRKPLKDKQDIIRKILIKTLSDLSYIYRLTWVKISKCLLLVIWKRKKNIWIEGELFPRGSSGSLPEQVFFHITLIAKPWCKNS